MLGGREDNKQVNMNSYNILQMHSIESGVGQ